MTDLSKAVVVSSDEFTSRPVGSPTMPCESSTEGGLGLSINRSIAKARRWVFGHFTQRKSNSCVIASSRNMIHALTGENVPEETLRKEMKEIIGDPNHDFETTGVNPAYAEALLQKHGVNTASQYYVSSGNLPDLVKDGQPALIGFKDPGHRVMLDSVSIDKDGKRTYNIRDPDPAYGGRVREMSQSDFDAKYNPNAIVIVGKTAE